MTKQEFQTSAKIEVTEQDFIKIHEVYNFHPAISINPLEAKKKIAEIYIFGGMALIKDMLPRAKKAQELESKIINFRNQLELAEHELEILKNGNE